MKEVGTFNNIRSELNKLKGRRIRHFNLIGNSYSHAFEFIEKHANQTLEHAGREEALSGSQFVNISPDMPFYSALLTYFLLVIELDGNATFMLDLTPPLLIMPFIVKSEDVIMDTTDYVVGKPNVDADKLLSPAVGKQITDVIINSFEEYEFDLTLCLEDDIHLSICADQTWLRVECCYENGNIYQLPFSELKEYLWLSNDDKETLAKQSHYVDIGCFSEDMCRVATLTFELGNLAYHSDHYDKAGIWGYINKYAEEVIKPQYIYAFDFYKGIAIVAKGRWVKECEDEGGRPRYWSEDERWGGIDYTGNEVIPFIFDEIRYFSDTTDYYIAHSGGWPAGKWGVIDRTGKWFVTPRFKWLNTDWNDGLLVFGYYDTEIYDDLYGLYDASSDKVLLEPVYGDIWFNDDCTIEIKSYDKDHSRWIARTVRISDLK